LRTRNKRVSLATASGRIAILCHFLMMDISAAFKEQLSGRTLIRRWKLTGP
jgi:hypothetical protein